MTEPANQPDPEVDARLAVWLREAAVEPLGDIAEPVAKVRRTFLAKLPGARKPPARRMLSLWARHRLAFGGIAASIALAGALLMALNSGVQLSAMERMAKELEEITSYSCRSSGTNTGIDENGKRVLIKDEHIASWLAPYAYRQETKIVGISEDVDGGNHTEKVVADFDQALPLDKAGAFIDHLYKTYSRFHYEPAEDPSGAGIYPWEFLRLIREGSYDVLADLGTKRSGDTSVHGYRLTLKNQRDTKDALHDPVELWVDSQTNLPVDISWSGEGEGWKHTDRTTDFRWNVPLDPKSFEPVLPRDYADITPPSDAKDLDQIAAALRLYADLSGGHYPQTRKIDPTAIHDEMLKMSDGAQGGLRKEIDQSMTGLNWLERILRNRFVSGYRGLKVGPDDKDKVLLWMPADMGYRVFYGDLRTEIVNEDKWSKLVPSDEVVDIHKIE